MPSLQTYRRFRFCLYMQILDDSKRSKSDAWEKWEDICDYDMRPREKEFLSFVVSKVNELKQYLIPYRHRSGIYCRYYVLTIRNLFTDLPYWIFFATAKAT